MLCNLSVGPSLARGTFGTEGTCTVAVGMLPPVPLSLVFVSQGNGTSRCFVPLWFPFIACCSPVVCVAVRKCFRDNICITAIDCVLRTGSFTRTKPAGQSHKLFHLFSSVAVDAISCWLIGLSWPSISCDADGHVLA